MKKLLILTLLTFVLILAACGGSASEESAPQTDDSNREFSMPTEMALMVGTVKLDETDYAINAEQAAELLPLWKALRSLSESETAASAEIEIVISQIEDSMTSEQMDAITAMELTMEDMATVQEALGVEGGFGNMSPEMRATMQAARESGEFPAGGPGGGDIPVGGSGGGQGFGGGEVDPVARETAMAERGSSGNGFSINAAFLDAIIEFLEAKIQ